MSEADRPEELSADRKALLEKRLEELRAELRDLAQDRLRWSQGGPKTLRDQSEKLESEADAIRSELGLEPALGRPPRGGLAGWIVMSIAALAILAGAWQLVR